MSHTYDDEIDLFELFQVLWDGKWIIGTFIAIGILLGIGFILFNDKVYESKIVYATDTIPPFYSAGKASTDFQKSFTQ